MVAQPRPSTSLQSETAHARYLNREQSDLQFKSRVLEMAEDAMLPLLERVKFLSIVATNLDEFYMVRVAGLKRQQAAALATLSADGLTPTQQLSMISGEVAALAERHARAFTDEVLPALHEQGVRLRRWRELSAEQHEEAAQIFRERVFPILTPLAVDPGHPFPYISNRSLNLAVFVQDEHSKVHFARVKVPPLLPRFVALSCDEPCFVPLEDVIAANLSELFQGMRILEWHSFRVTRDAELEVDDDGAEDLLSALEQELTRRRFSRATRLEVEKDAPEHLLQLLMRELGVDDEDVFAVEGPLDLSALMQFYDLDRPDLKDAPFQPANHPQLVKADESQADVFNVLRQNDILVHHPYESFANSVQLFIEQAAADPDVLAIKQTLYRTSGDSPIVDALIEAAEAGKQVVVLVEIKARFDEIANINWARALEKAGCHVVYGLMGLKTHCKLCMVVRREGDVLRRYVHIGTGNYNPATARVYEDIGLLTADPKLGADIGNLFNYLTGYSRHESYASLLVAPHEMRKRMLGLIQREAKHAREGRAGRIIFKMNALVDEAIIDGLYDASQAGVQIDVICRGICALRPSVAGLSENIRVRSIVGRYLEHSRMYYFGNDGEEQLYIGSADMMHRNLDRRVEVLVRVDAPNLRKRLVDVLQTAEADNTCAWTLGPTGEWQRVIAGEGEPRHDLQKELMQRAGQAQ